MEVLKVNDIIQKLKQGELDNPGELSNYLVILSASLNTAGQFALDARINFASKWAELRPNCKTDKECDMKIMATEEYKDMELAKIAIKTTEETIRALKKKLSNLQFEMSEGQNY